MKEWQAAWRGRRRIGILIGGAVALVALVPLAFFHHRASIRAAVVRADPDAIFETPLRAAASAAGRSLFARHCAGCHGKDGRGRAGVTDLTDHDWLYGEGRVSEIEAVVRYGIRSHNPKGWNLASMPAYASARPYAAEPLPSLSPPEVDDVVRLLLAYEGKGGDPAAVARGKAVYTKAGCWDCHGPDAQGDTAIGAPNLRDGVALYGGSADALRQSVERGRRGVSPAFAGHLSPFEIRAVAVYAADLSRQARSPSAKKVAP